MRCALMQEGECLLSIGHQTLPAELLRGRITRRCTDRRVRFRGRLLLLGAAFVCHDECCKGVGPRVSDHEKQAEVREKAKSNRT